MTITEVLSATVTPSRTARMRLASGSMVIR